jgi:hypothetical protein
MCLQYQNAAVGERPPRLVQKRARLGWPKDVELTKDHHHKFKTGTELGRPDVLAHVAARDLTRNRLFLGVGYRGRGEVNAHTLMPKGGEAAGIQARSAAEIKDARGALPEHLRVNPTHVFLSLGRAPACHVMCLGEVLREHPLTEPGLIPGDVVSFFPRLRYRFLIHKVEQGLHSDSPQATLIRRTERACLHHPECRIA